MADKVPARKAKTDAAAQGGLLSTYKPGQGFWTRIGTSLGGAILLLFLLLFIHNKMPAWVPGINQNPGLLYGIVAGIGAVLLAIGFLLLNRPKHAEFLIETDAEMKKVSWPTWPELIGSTRVVIIFMLLMGLVLFLYDLFFGYGFFLINVNKINPLAG